MMGYWDLMERALEEAGTRNIMMSSIINEPDRSASNQRALHLAIRHRHWNFALRLLDVPGIAVDVQDDFGSTPLMYMISAIRRDDDDNEETVIIVRELLERNANLLWIRDSRGDTPLSVARHGGCAVLNRLLLRAYWDKVLLVQDGRLALHTILRKIGFAGRRKPMRLDTTIGRLTAIELKDMMMGGIIADPSLLRVRDSSGMLPLHVAAKRGAPVHVLQMLGFPGALRVADNTGGLAIHAACRAPTRRSTLRAIRYLVETGGAETVRKRDHDGCLPLHLVLRDKKPFHPIFEVVQCLVEANPASLSCRAMDGNLPITLAGKPPSLEVIYFMMRRFPAGVDAAIKV